MVFAKSAQPLTKLFPNNMKFEFSDGCKAAFPNDRLINFPKIRAPGWNHPFEVMCDASNHAVRAVLSQKIQGESYISLYVSETLNRGQRNYDATEKEVLSVVFAFGKFGRYLLGSREFEWEVVDKKRCEDREVNHLRRILREGNKETIPADFSEGHMHLIKSLSEEQRICQEGKIDQSKQRSWGQHAQKRAVFADMAAYLVASELTGRDGMEAFVVGDIPLLMPSSHQ
ncbi:uncharacterized protein LOC121757545 [Salvia splendens]|uniref:uncharacterized protein LOC121757545 n=1 Tax=Salvia splendens TaxID=180675 RepID=UPI001C262653|nr:uncharacterized protein LOC121757545 [Salvia splendens]